jgi:RNA polymerase sigma-B factor
MKSPAPTRSDQCPRRTPVPSRAGRDKLIQQYLPLARRLARQYRHTTVSLEDLTQVAYMGLVLAADRYDPARGCSFPTYAIPTILGELRRHIRDHGWALRVPRGLQEKVLRVTSANAAMSGRLGRSPTPGELAKETGLSTDEVLEAMQATSAYDPDSLDSPTRIEDETQDSAVAMIGREEPGYALVEHRASARPALAELSAVEHTIIGMRFFEDLSQSEIARRIGVSQMQVSRVLRRALDRLHRAMDAAA